MNHPSGARRAVAEAMQAESTGELELAATKYCEAASLSNGYPRAWAHHQEAVVLRQLGKLGPALQALDSAEIAVRSDAPAEFEAELLLTRANVRADQQEFETAAEFAEELRAVFEATGLIVESQFAELVNLRSRIEMGEAECEDDLRRLSAPGVAPQVRSQALNYLARARGLQGDYPGAMRAHLDDARLSRGVGDVSGECVAVANAALAAFRADDRSAALAMANHVLDAAPDSPAASLARELIQQIKYPEQRASEAPAD